MSTEFNETIKQKYISAALINSKALAEGDHKTANRNGKVLRNIHREIVNGKIEKKFLLELLSHESLAVKVSVAAEMLRLEYETEKAEKTLEEITSLEAKGIEDGLRINGAKWALRFWRKKKYLQ